MKNIMSFSLIFSFLFSIACSDSAPKNSTENPEPMAKTVAEKRVEPTSEVAETETPQSPVSEEKIEETTSTVSNNTDKKPAAKPIKKAENIKKEPTSQPKPESVKPSPKNDAPAEKIEKVIEKSPKVEETKVTPKPEAPQKTSPDHSNWNALLQKNVSAVGKVNYQGFKTQKTELQKYLDELSVNPPADDWSRKEKMAYWINAYNAFTVKLIVDNYPLSSITNLENGKPWDKKWIKLGDKTYSLNNIENDILRPTYKDARIHFAVNCAAKSCPPLLNQAWTADNLNANLEKQAKAFINNTKFNKINSKSVEISKIFDWYKEDFGSIIDYLNKYSTTKIDADAKVSYREYDWALNE